jgi:hypothetical protein
MYTTLDEAESAFRAEFIKVDRIATDLGNKKRRAEKVAIDWEISKNRAAMGGVRFYRVEDEYLEFGGPLPWDKVNGYLLTERGLDLRPKYA